MPGFVRGAARTNCSSFSILCFLAISGALVVLFLFIDFSASTQNFIFLSQMRISKPNDGNSRFGMLSSFTSSVGIVAVEKPEQPVEVKLERNVTGYLTLSVPKTGTTVVGWIIQSLFRNIKKYVTEEAVSSGMKEVDGPLVETKFMKKIDTLLFKGKEANFMTRRKHHGYVYAQHRGSLMEYEFYFPVQLVLNRVLEKNLSAKSTQVFQWMNSSKHLKPYTAKNAGDVEPRELSDKVVHFSTFRDPIAVAISYSKYYSPERTPEELNQRLIDITCAKWAAWMSIMWQMTTVVLPMRGYEFHPFFFKDLREQPEAFVKEMIQHLGLTVPEAIIQKVVGETSPQHMREVQEDLKHLVKEDEKFISYSTRYDGLSDRGRNSRKVGTASVKGYEQEISPQALAHCQRMVAFHLPEDLQRKLGFLST